MNSNNIEKKSIEEVIKGIREVMEDPSIPNADILELKDKIEDMKIKHSMLESLKLNALQRNLVDNSLDNYDLEKQQQPQIDLATLEQRILDELKPTIASWLNNNLARITRDVIETELKR